MQRPASGKFRGPAFVFSGDQSTGAPHLPCSVKDLAGWAQYKGSNQLENISKKRAEKPRCFQVS